MTDAERQARCRAARAAGRPAVRTRRPADHRSRVERWCDTVAASVQMQAEYAAWLETLLEALHNDATTSATAPRVRPPTSVIQKKTGRPVQFEITGQTRETVLQWITRSSRRAGDYLFPSRIGKNKPLTPRHYARLMGEWVTAIGLDPAFYGTYSLRRTKVALITAALATSAPLNCCSDTKLESAALTPALKWTTPWPSPSRWTLYRHGGGHHTH